jgi:hypothetical protein
VITALEHVEFDRQLARERQRGETIERRRKRRPAFSAN